MEKVILIRCGELTLKGLNRRIFETQLQRNIKAKLVDFAQFKLIHSQSRYFIEAISDEFDFEKAIEQIITVPGLVSVSLAYKTNSDYEDICKLVKILISDKLQFSNEKTSFKVNTRRGDKNFPLDSLEVNREIGGFLLDTFENKLYVDVIDPELMVYIEIREETYVFTDKIDAIGGLPVGTGGRAMLLISGGIDSPVAGYMVSKRGVKIEAIHFHSYPYTSERAKMKVVELSKRIGKFNNGIMLHIIPFTEIQLYLKENFDVEYLTILMRKIMMQIAEKVANETNCSALVTGEAIGQVASQTLDSINVVNRSVEKVILRPLIGFDKNDIINIAKKIDTFETSILPYEDCCTIFVAKHPKTKPKQKDIEEIEFGYVNMDIMIETAIKNREVIKL